MGPLLNSHLQQATTWGTPSTLETEMVARTVATTGKALIWRNFCVYRKRELSWVKSKYVEEGRSNTEDEV